MYCPKCGKQKIKKMFEHFERCEECDWTSKSTQNETNEKRKDYYTPKPCENEKCFCGKPAYRKVSEIIFDDDPLPETRQSSSYVCTKHWKMIMVLK